ncbi:MAG: FAD-binding oxidoreductase [Planctomycetota bacterium]
MAQATGSGLASTFEYVEGWGMAVGAHAKVFRPRSVEEIVAVFERARADGVSLALRGTGNSYGDASCNAEGHVLDISRMNRLLHFDTETGIATCEPGVTIEQLWKHIVPLGFWPKVVSGTAFPTLAGAAAMNIHGKNNYKVGTIGDHILEFDLILPSGELRTCNREENADLFHAAIGGFGMLGCFARIVLQTHRVYSGELEVRAFANRNLREMMAYMEAGRGEADYLVGWIDMFGSGDTLGRGLIHDARYLDPGADHEPERTLSLDHQILPSKVAGVFPKSELWRVLRFFCNDPGMRLINFSKYISGRLEAMGPPQRWRHAEFAFLLDFVPNWKWAYGRTEQRGLIQHQIFLPKETAHEAYREILGWNQRNGYVPYLGVFKRHRPDPFWLTHAVDGWSLAQDYKVTPRNRAGLWAHCDQVSRIATEAGGKFYFAKDLVIGTQDMLRAFPPDRLRDFLALKAELDPDRLLQTNLWRRIFAPAASC